MLERQPPEPRDQERGRRDLADPNLVIFPGEDETGQPPASIKRFRLANSVVWMDPISRGSMGWSHISAPPTSTSVERVRRVPSSVGSNDNRWTARPRSG